MLKKLSGWYRLFIVFAGVWTVYSIGLFTMFYLSEKPNTIEQVKRDWLSNHETSRERLESLYLEKDRRGILTVKERAELRLIQQNDVPNIEELHKQELSRSAKARKDAIFYFCLGWLAPG
jgi:hypothetical protein